MTSGMRKIMNGKTRSWWQGDLHLIAREKGSEVCKPEVKPDAASGINEQPLHIDPRLLDSNEIFNNLCNKTLDDACISVGYVLP
jgi:hypothetical protein